MSEIEVYWFCLGLGVAGLLGMVLMGAHHGDASHGGSHGGAHSHHDFGHDVGHHSGHAHHGGHATHSSTHHDHDFSHAKTSASSTILGLLSPRVLFSFLTGLGATGVAASSYAVGAVLLGIAVLGGAVFEGAIVRPLWKFLMGFASKPARNLETRVLEEARAVMDFDARGNGLVSLEMNGEIVQVLARLRPEDRETTRVRSGDKLMVVEVDGARNSCVVTPVKSV